MNVKAREREGRVKVTWEIERKLFKLVLNEQDTQKKKKHPANWYRGEVAKELKLVDNTNPSLRAYEDKLQVIRKKLQEKDPLDKPWCIGSCLENRIPGDVIPVLIRAKKVLGGILTIRQARWASLLYPAFKPMLEVQSPNDVKMQDLFYNFYSIIFREYALRERFFEALGKDIDTSALDTVVFDPSNVNDVKCHVFPPGVCQLIPPG